MTTHKEPEVTEDIPPLCVQTFLTRDKFIVVMWILGGLLLTACSTAITYAMSNNNTVVTIKERQINDGMRLDGLDREINKKLDILIERKDK